MSQRESERPRVAIACQGGGSHTAFTAGVLDRLLAEEDVAFDVVELSGTSGGAICAFAAWFGLASEGPEDGRPEARRLLGQVWDDIAAKTSLDAWMNSVGVEVVRAQSRGVPVPSVGPYDSPVSEWSRRVLRQVLEGAVDPDALGDVVGRTDPLPPRLDVGAVDVQRGTFRTFTERDVTHDAVLASAAVPPLFRAAPVVQSDGTTRWYWDGLFSQNPPLGDLFGSGEGRQDRADELWIVQINPQREDELPTTLEAIADRRNELSGNISLNQELRVIERVNDWIDAGHLPESDFQHTEVRRIPMGKEYHCSTKVDRSPSFLQELMDLGEQRATEFRAEM